MTDTKTDTKTTTDAPAAGTAGDAHVEERLDSLRGDRLCVRCGYNLIGQPIVREAHYDMLVVRCPECGTVAPLQEYPRLSTWAARWGVLLAAFWFAVLIGLLFGLAGVTYATGESVGRNASMPYATHLAKLEVDWWKSQQAAGAPATQAAQQWAAYVSSQPANPYIHVDLAWWSLQDPEALLAEQGGWGAAADWTALAPLLPFTLFLAVAGSFWTVALPHWRRRRLVLLALIVPGLAGAIFALSWFEGSPVPASWQPILELARVQIGPPFMIITLVWSVLVLAAALALGRPLVRLALRLLLPPRLRAPLARLWTIDGLKP